MPSFIAALKQHLPEADWPVVVSALRNQAEIWQQLQSGEFSVRALQAAGGERARWCPAFLGLLALGAEQQFEGLRAVPMQPVAEKLRYDAAAAYEQLAKSKQTLPMPDLAQATLLALALRERRRLLNSWEQLRDDVSIAPADFWKLPLACLLGLVPGQHELLQALLMPEQPQHLRALALHSLVSNPLSMDVQASHLTEIISAYELPQLLGLLRQLAPLNGALAQQLAAQVLDDLQGVPVDGRDGLSEIQSLLLQAEIYQLGRQADRASALLQSAWQAAQQLQLELGARVAEANQAETPMLVAVKQSAELANPKNLSAATLATKRPAALLAAARVAMESLDLTEAKELAIAALSSAASSAKAEEGYEKAKLLRELGTLFAELDLPQEAEHAAKSAIELQPNDADSAAVLGRMLKEKGRTSEALEYAQLAAVLAPQRADLRRQLAETLAANRQFEEAYIEWKAAIDYSEQPNTQDWLAFAGAALASDHIEDVIRACGEVLAQEPANGVAYALMGKAVAAQGDDTSAIDYLRRATDLTPGDLSSWLALASLLRAHKRTDEALAVLQTAQKYCAPSAKIQYILAETYRSLNRVPEALAAYRYAANLAAEQSDGEIAQAVAVQLSGLQTQLGEATAALNTLEAAQRAYPGNLEIARQLGKLLMAAGEAKRALSCLLIAREGAPDDVDVLTHIAQAQLAQLDHQVEAEETLRSILARKDAPVQALGLLAEALFANGKHTEAIKQYDKALNSDLAHDAGWRKKLTLGKAASQTACGRPVAAIATLEGIEKEYNQDLDVLRALCNAYKRAGRVDEAALLAENSLNYGNDEASLLWYAETMQELGKSAEACKALGATSKASLESPPAQLALAKLKWEGESKKASLDAFAKLLDCGDVQALRKSATFLFAHEAIEDSIRFFERAIELTDSDAELWGHLTQAYIASENFVKALDALEKNIQLSPHKPQLLETKADLLQRLGKPQAALQALSLALELLPNDVSILTRKVTLLCETGDWNAALTAAAQAFELNPGDPTIVLAAAELAVLCQQPEQARLFLAKAKRSGKPEDALLCLQAELALGAGNEIEAAKLAAQLISGNEKDPRVLGLQAQLAACRGDNTQADQLLLQALAAGGEIEPIVSLALGKAAERIANWESAIRLYEALAKARPGILAANFALGRAIVLQTEWQRLCAASGAIEAQTGVRSAKQSCTVAKKAFTAASSLAGNAATQALIAGWQTRADLRFGTKLDIEHLPQNYPSTSEEAAALFAAFGSANEVRIKDYWEAPEVLTERGLANKEGAFNLFAKAAKQLTANAPVQALAAQAAKQAGEAKDALQFIRRALAIWPRQPGWQALAGEIQSALGSNQDAAQHFQMAIELVPEEAKYHFAYGKALAAAGNVSAAVPSLQRAAELQPNNADYLLALAVAHRQAGDAMEARSLAAKAVKAAPENLGAILTQAELALEAGDGKAAKSYCEQALRLAPKDARALLLFAEALFVLGQTEDAIAVMERARGAADDEVPVLIRKAQMQPAARRLDELVKLSQKHAHRPEVFFALSQALAQGGAIAEAIQAAQHAVKKAATLPNGQQAALHLHLGGLLKQNGNLDQSLHHLDEAARLDPRSAIANLERGRVFLGRRQHAQALAAFRQASTLAPQMAEPHFEAGLALKEAKDYSAAEIELRQAARLEPKDRNIQKQLAAVIALNLVHHPAAVGVEL